MALGSVVLRAFDPTYADDLLRRAVSAYTWAETNPGVTFYNNDAASGTSGLGSGQQETDDYGRLSKKITAAVFLFEASGDAKYRNFVDASFRQMHLLTWGFAYPFEPEQQQALLHYSSLAGATAATRDAIRTAYLGSMHGDDNFVAHSMGADPYLAYIKDYTWGSNAVKAHQANLFMDLVTYGLDPTIDADSTRAAERYIHYLHGVNPFGMVYLSNMYGFGAERSANEFYHSWFVDGSARWDRVGESTFGPPPGFVPGGPNPAFSPDACCPNSCGSVANDAGCQSLSPPLGQPVQKSYKDFNTSWPANSWQVTENSNGYQAPYIRLLSKFVR
jgi:hypothetical protein